MKIQMPKSPWPSPIQHTHENFHPSTLAKSSPTFTTIIPSPDTKHPSEPMVTMVDVGDLNIYLTQLGIGSETTWLFLADRLISHLHVSIEDVAPLKEGLHIVQAHLALGRSPLGISSFLGPLLVVMFGKKTSIFGSPSLTMVDPGTHYWIRPWHQ